MAESTTDAEGFVQHAREDHAQVRALLQQCKTMLQQGQTGPGFGVIVHKMLQVLTLRASSSASHVCNSGWCQIAQAVIKHSKEEEEELIPKLQAMDANFQKAAMNRLEYYTGEAAARGVVLK